MKVYTHEDVLKLMNRIHVYEINRDLCMLKLTPIDMEEKLLEYWNGGIKSTEEGGKSFDQYYNETYGSKGSDAVEKTNSQRFDEFMQLVTSSQTEISDEEINDVMKPMTGMHEFYKAGFVEGATWYREQLSKSGATQEK